MNEYERMVRDLDSMEDEVWYRIYRKDDSGTGWKYLSFDKALVPNEARGYKYNVIVKKLSKDTARTLAWRYEGLIRRHGDFYELGEFDDSGAGAYRRARLKALEENRLCEVCKGKGFIE